VFLPRFDRHPAGARLEILSLVPQAAVIEGDIFGSVGPLVLALDARGSFG